MDIDFTSFFKRYEDLSTACGTVFQKVKSEHKDCVKCRIECADCCHAVFDLSLIEAIYINYHFNRLYKEADRNRLLEKANRADRTVYRLKRNAYRDLESGKNEVEILNALAMERVRCPLLDENNRCELYAHRPITCRLYGIPTSIAGKGHTCGLSGFKEGRPYPTVKLEKIQQQLYEISADLVRSIKSRHVKMAELLVPLSMALLTDYDKTYLGINSDESSDDTNKGENNE